MLEFNLVEGTPGDDSLTGSNDPNVIDFLNGGSGDDTIEALSGDDFLIGDLGDDLLLGGAGNDELNGDAGSDTLVGGADDDALFGGEDGDVFAFAFAVETSGGEPVTLVAPDFDGLTQSQFVKAYKAWLLENGIDVDDPDSGWTWSQNDEEAPLRFNGEAVGVAEAVDVITGRKTKERWIATEIPTGESGEGETAITGSDGNDTIFDFDAADVIEFAGLGGLDAATLDALFDITVADVDGSGAADTVLSWAGGSLTVLDWTFGDGSLAAFFASDQVVLTDPGLV